MDTYKSDPFIYKENVKNRLLKELEKHGKLIIAFDFDYTVHNYRAEDDFVYNTVINLLREWRPFAHFIVFTASPEERYDYIRDYLHQNDIPFDKINEDILQRNYTRKIYYNVFLDDRAGLGETVKILSEILDEIKDGNIQPSN